MNDWRTDCQSARNPTNEPRGTTSVVIALGDHASGRNCLQQMMTWPDVTIVTATLDRLALLKAAIASIETQKGNNLVEHIVVDGGSRDGTIEWLSAQGYTSEPSGRLRLIKGPDTGVYHALNKGLTAASGRYLVFLNSDDLLLPNAIEIACERLADPALAAVAGTGVLCHAEATLSHSDARLRTFDKPGEIEQDIRTVFLGHCALNSHVFRRDVLMRLGGFDLAFPLVADRDLMVRFLLGHHATADLGCEVYCYRRHAGSLTFHVDQDVEKQISLRKDLLALAQRWQRIDAPHEARALSRVLEGRTRIGLLRLAIRADSFRAELLQSALSQSPIDAAYKMAIACFDMAFDVLPSRRFKQCKK